MIGFSSWPKWAKVVAIGLNIIGYGGIAASLIVYGF